MIKATLGFVFTPDLKKVLLIQKNRPVWQAGLINGLGGKCEPGEDSLLCVSRELYEESGLVLYPQDWQFISQIVWAKWRVDIFATVLNGAPTQAQAKTDEAIGWYEVEHLPDNVMSNLRWLIPLSIDVMTKENPPQVSIHYAD